MTKGDRDKMRAEIAGRALQGLIAADITRGAVSRLADSADRAVIAADCLMDRLGLSEASEQAEIQREAERRRGGVS